MRRTPFLVAFAAAAVAAGLGRAVTTSYLPLLLDRIDDEPGLIGTIMLVNAAAGMVVPLVIGLWSDRRARVGRGRRLPFIIGGALLTSGGLAAVALGSSSSYLILAFAAAAVYTGLNAVTTAHRSLVPELFSPSGRAKATSAQELSLLAGGLLGLTVGGLLTEVGLWVPFAVSAALVPLLVLPTVLRTEEPAAAAVAPAGKSQPIRYYLRAAARPGVRGFLAAQILWVLAYAALPTFFLLYADEVLGLDASVASLWLAGFGVATAVAIVGAGRVRDPRLHRPLLHLGVVLMGTGFLVISTTTSLVAIGPSLIVSAIGFGLISTLGFPLFSTYIPDGEAGGYTALYFSVRAISSTIALPAAGWLVEITGSYRALFVLGGIAALLALVPLAHVRRPSRLETAAGLLLAVPALGVLVAQTGLQRLDEEIFRAVNGLGPGPDLLWTLLDPHTRNYVLLIALALGVAALATTSASSVLARMLGSALLSWGLLEAVYTAYDRDRPEEVLGAAEIGLTGHTWARLESFPSGHMAITSALAVSMALAFPRLRVAMWGYVAAVAFTRVLFGAHFPLDTVAGVALGTASALAVATILERRQREGAPRVELGAAPLDPARVAAIMPSHGDIPARSLVAETLGQVGRFVLVDDGSSAAVALRLDEVAADTGVDLLRLPEQRGKGSAVRAGFEHALRLDPSLEAVLVIDADGQHPPSAIPGFLAEGAAAELVIGDRFHDLTAMPWQRRVANRTTSRLMRLVTGHAVRDTQNGMRLLRGRALDLLPPTGGYEAETHHLMRALREGVRVGWVPMPAIYADERSSFRAVRDGARILWAIVGPMRNSKTTSRPIAAPSTLPATTSVQ